MLVSLKVQLWDWTGILENKIFRFYSPRISCKLVKCHGLGLTEIPSGIPSGTKVLDLTDNEITDLDFTKLAGLEALKDLYLSKNHLQIEWNTTFKSST